MVMRHSSRATSRSAMKPASLAISGQVRQGRCRSAWTRSRLRQRIRNSWPCSLGGIRLNNKSEPEIRARVSGQLLVAHRTEVRRRLRTALMTTMAVTHIGTDCDHIAGHILIDGRLCGFRLVLEPANRGVPDSGRIGYDCPCSQVVLHLSNLLWVCSLKTEPRE